MALTDNLISYWKLDGNSNDSVASNNGTDTAITYSAGNGKIVQGAGFNGSTSNIDIGSPASLDDLSVLSYAFWINVSSLAAEIMPISKNYKWFRVRTDGTIESSIGASGTTNSSISTNTVSTSTWYHIVFTYDDAGDRKGHIYLNGSEVTYGTQTACTGTITADNAFNQFIGQYQGGLFRWNGAIDEVGIWSRVLSGAEITQLYNSGSGLSYPFTSTNTTRLTLLNVS